LETNNSPNIEKTLFCISKHSLQLQDIYENAKGLDQLLYLPHTNNNNISCIEFTKALVDSNPSQMLLCKVLIGNSSPGDSQVYQIYNENRSYPLYIVEYNK